ncbi:helix-turn-helix transcriptional regulator [Shewanella sp. 10N.286.51.B8]|uniref:helix-turn-helix transcriptional regulator n=1 Tax=Shewanella sp. 10N.286.51.B8 TaxID=3229708 RepID=UPI0035521D91
MIKFLVRPALTAKAILNYCQDNNVILPEEFDVIRSLSDDDLISSSAPIKMLECIEQQTNNAEFFSELMKVCTDTWLQAFYRMAPPRNDADMASQLVDFYENIHGMRINHNWSLVETNETVSLVSRSALHGKFNDLLLYSFLIKMMSQPNISATGTITAEFSLKSEEYLKYLDFPVDTKFGTNDTSVGKFVFSVSKLCDSKVYNPMFLSKRITDYDLLIAASNMIPINKLNISSLAFILGISPRSLTKVVEEMGISLKTLINNVKYKKARRLLEMNNGNIKLTACDCGFTDQGRLTKIFNQTMGISPSEFLLTK